MAARRDLSELPEVPDGLTLSELARRATAQLGRPVTCQEVYAEAVRRQRVPVGRRRLVIRPAPREEVVMVVAPSDVDALMEGLRRRA